MRNFENTLKHVILKTVETYGEFWKHFETHNFENHWNLWQILKTLWNISFENHWNILKYIDTPLRHGHSGVTIETLGFQMGLKWNTCAVMHGEKICFFHAVESIDVTTTVWSNECVTLPQTPSWISTPFNLIHGTLSIRYIQMEQNYGKNV